MTLKGKRWLLALVSAVLVIGMLAACSSNSSNSSSSNSSSSSNQSSNSESSGNSSDGGSGEAGMSGTLEIQYFVGGYGSAWMEAIIKDFKKKYPDLTIKQYKGPKINKKMKTRWIQGDPPDLVYIDGAGSSPTQMVEDGLLLDITDWAKSVTLANGKKLLDSLVVPPSSYGDKGKIYTIPFIFDTWVTWYDAAWFEENGWKVPHDFPSFMDTMATIKKEADIYPFITTGVYPYYMIRGVLYPAFASEGGDELLAGIINGAKGAWTSKGAKKVMERVEKMVDKGFIDPGFAGINHTTSQAAFLQHKNAFIPVGLWLPNEMKNSTPEDFVFGAIPSPLHAAGTKGVLVPKNPPMAIAKKADNKKAAKKFLKFMFQAKYAKNLSETAGVLPNLAGVNLSEDPKVPGYLKDINQLMNSGKIEVHHKPHPMSATLEKPISDALVKLMLGKIDSEKFIDLAAKAAKQYRQSQ